MRLNFKVVVIVISARFEAVGVQQVLSADLEKDMHTPASILNV